MVARILVLFSMRLSELWPYNSKSWERICKLFGISMRMIESRRIRLAISWWLQNNKKWEVLSGAHWQSHQSLGVSAKLCRFLWHLRGLNQTRNWNNNFAPTGSWIPYIDLACGRTRLKIFFLKRLRDSDEQRSGPILFRDLIASGKKLFLNLTVVHNISCSLVLLSLLRDLPRNYGSLFSR